MKELCGVAMTLPESHPLSGFIVDLVALAQRPCDAECPPEFGELKDSEIVVGVCPPRLRALVLEGHELRRQLDAQKDNLSHETFLTLDAKLSVIDGLVWLELGSVFKDFASFRPAKDLGIRAGWSVVAEMPPSAA